MGGRGCPKSTRRSVFELWAFIHGRADRADLRRVSWSAARCQQQWGVTSDLLRNPTCGALGMSLSGACVVAIPSGSSLVWLKFVGLLVPVGHSSCFGEAADCGVASQACPCANRFLLTCRCRQLQAPVALRRKDPLPESRPAMRSCGNLRLISRMRFGRRAMCEASWRPALGPILGRGPRPTW